MDYVVIGLSSRSVLYSQRNEHDMTGLDNGRIKLWRTHFLYIAST